MHRRILGISASSAQPERDFSARLSVSGQPCYYWRLFKAVAENCCKQWNSFVGQCVVHCLTWMTY